MPANSERPLPQADRHDSKPFWDACRRGELTVQRCRDCGTWIWYPQDVCHGCNSWNVVWEPVGGRGSLYSWVVLRHPLHPYFADKLPVPIALVELDDAPGVRITTNIVECDLEFIHVGMPVEVVFEKVNDEVTLPMFRPAGP